MMSGFSQFSHRGRFAEDMILHSSSLDAHSSVTILCFVYFFSKSVNREKLPEIPQLVNRVQWGHEPLQSLHVVRAGHVFNEELHLSLWSDCSAR